jgi:hypothetical protein
MQLLPLLTQPGAHSTATTKVAVDLRLTPSVAVHVTVVLPAGKDTLVPAT